MKTSLKILIVLLSFYPHINLFSQNNPSLPPDSYKIYPDSFKVTNEMSVSDFLQGRVSGLDIIASSGDPGRNAEMILRGLNNSGINSPLVVIDGIPWWPLSEFSQGYSLISQRPRSLIPVTLNDIASIEILKDGPSASLYGAEGANGVILIETKKGRQQKMQLSYQFNQSVVEEPSFMPMLSGDEYIMYQLEARHNSGLVDIPPEIAYDRDYAGFYNYSANTDWIKAVTRAGSASNHFLNIAGGNKKNHYYGSINYLDQKGTIINSGHKRLSGRLFFEQYLTDKLTLSIQLSNAYNKLDGNLRPDDRNILEMAFIKAPNMSIWEYDSMGNRTGDYFVPVTNYQGNGQSYYNPVAVSQLGKSDNTQNELMTTGRIRYTLNEWLSFTESLTYLRSSKAYESYLPGKAISADWVYVSFPFIEFESEYISNQYRNEIQALYKIPFNDEIKHSMKGTLTWITQDLKNKTEYGPDHYKSDWHRNTAVSSLIYRLMDRYILNANSRLESLFYESHWDKHFGFSGGWQFSEEPWLKGFHSLDFGIIHAGWSYAVYHPFEFIQSVPSWHEPEITAQTFNIGIRMGILNNRIHLDADYYNKLSRQEISDPVSAVKLKSNGWEVMVDYGLIRKRNFSMELNFNIAHNNSIVKEAPELSHWGIFVNGRYLGVTADNKSLGSIYGLVYEGLYSTDQDAIARDGDGNILYDNQGDPRMISYDYQLTRRTFQGGDVKYKDINYDGIINVADAVYLGNSLPEYTGGFGSTVEFKNLSLTCNFHYRSGYSVIRQAALESEGMVSFHNQSKEVLNRWMVPGDQGAELNHRAFLDHPANNLGSDKYISNGDFLRMNYASLGYDISPKICQKLHLSEISLNLSAQRLFTVTNYDGIDPEIEMESYGTHRDVIRAYPPKIYTFSIQVVL